jgi:hypothetical protein
MNKDEVDDSALVGLRGIVKISHAIVLGQHFDCAPWVHKAHTMFDSTRR